MLLAEILFAVTPTGAATERVFSTVAWHHAPRRARLKVSATQMVCGITTHLRRNGEPDLLDAKEAAKDAKENRGRAAKRAKRQAAADAAAAAAATAGGGGGAPAGGVEGQLAPPPEVLVVADSDAEGGVPEEPAEDPPLAEEEGEEEEEEEDPETAAERILAALEESRKKDIEECVVNFTSETLDEMLRKAWQNLGVDIESPILGGLEVPTLETAAAPPARVPSFGDGAEAVDDEEVEELVAAQLRACYGTVAM